MVVFPSVLEEVKLALSELAKGPCIHTTEQIALAPKVGVFEGVSLIMWVLVNCSFGNEML